MPLDSSDVARFRGLVDAKAEPKMVEVRNVNVPGYRGRLNAEKYGSMRKVLLAVLPRGPPGLSQKEMMEAVRAKASRSTFPGSTHMWWAKSVQLDLEARRVIQRDKDAKPLRWFRRRD